MEPLGDAFNGASTDKQRAHFYGPIYQWLLDSLSWRNPDRGLRVLEVGVSMWAPQGSFQVWQSHKNIDFAVGVDIEPYVGEVVPPHQFIQGDAYDIGFVESLVSRFSDGFDLVIDDCCHSTPSQGFFLNQYLRLCAPGGYLLIEDVGSPEVVQATLEMSDTVVIDLSWNRRHLDPERKILLSDNDSRVIIRKQEASCD